MTPTTPPWSRLIVSVIGIGMVGVSNATVMFFNSSSVANNASERSAWLTAIGIGAPDLIEDFESIALNTNISGVTGLLAGGLVVTDTTSAAAAFVRGSSTYFGGSNPVGTRSVAHNEGNSLRLDFGPIGVDYVGGLDIDHAGTTIVVTYADNSTSAHSLETTAASGDSAEFWGFYRNDMPRIVRLDFDASGDGEWGLDNIEFSAPVPEPATMALAGLALAVAARRRRSRRA